MARSHLGSVRNKLQGYAERGVFRGFAETPGRNGKTSFEFRWLMDKTFTFIADPARGKLTFQNLFPNVPPRSDFYGELQSFVAARHNGALPAHRRIDPKRAEVRCVYRKGNVSLELTVHRNQFAYGTAKLIKLVNELFGHLHMYHPQYLWDNFDVPAE